MFKSTYEVTVTYKYTVEVDNSNELVKEYESRTDLIEQLASYRFSPTLPVVNNGVEVKDVDLEEVSFVLLKLKALPLDLSKDKVIAEGTFKDMQLQERISQIDLEEGEEEIPRPPLEVANNSMENLPDPTNTTTLQQQIEEAFKDEEPTYEPKSSRYFNPTVGESVFVPHIDCTGQVKSIEPQGQHPDHYVIEIGGIYTGGTTLFIDSRTITLKLVDLRPIGGKVYENGFTTPYQQRSTEFKPQIGERVNYQIFEYLLIVEMDLEKGTCGLKSDSSANWENNTPINQLEPIKGYRYNNDFKLP